jgi:hypothetical protein
MNTLAFRTSEDNGLSFELLVDGRPLGTLIGSRDTAFPYWIVEDGLPHWPPHGDPDDPAVRIVCVCSCGEYGCGHAQCRVAHEGGEVVFHEFAFDVSREGSRQVFRFPAANYATVCSEIAARVQEQRDRDERARA